jgi:signal transduction histidine kinase
VVYYLLQGDSYLPWSVAYSPILTAGEVLMAQDSQEQVVSTSVASSILAHRWTSSLGLAVAVGVGYFFAARLSLALLTKPDGVAVFWPAAGISAGVLIGLGSNARLPVVAGAMAATIVANLSGDRNIWSAIIFAICNAGEAVLVAGIIEVVFGFSFSLDSVRRVLGLIAATTVGTAISGIGGTLGFVLFHHSMASSLTIWQHWFASDAIGIITVAPVLIGLLSVSRDPPPRIEVIEGSVALAILATVCVLNTLTPEQPWAAVITIISIFPLLLWVAARCRVVFAAIASFIIALAIVWTTTFDIGILGNSYLPITERILAAQASILTVSLCALVLAALFAERKANEVRLARSNAMLERERDNKFMNLEAMAGAIAHEVRQPLAAIEMHGAAALRFLVSTPPNFDEVQSALGDIVNESRRASDIFDSIRALFGKTDPTKQPVDVNEVALEALRNLTREINVHEVVVRTKFSFDLPPVMGNKSQLQEVIINLVRNAIEAMTDIKYEQRTLKIATGRDGEAISLEVEDAGPGIAPGKLHDIFDAFVSTKPHGMGLGLAICRMIVNNHEGQISVAPAHPHGAIFRVCLPQTKRPH